MVGLSVTVSLSQPWTLFNKPKVSRSELTPLSAFHRIQTTRFFQHPFRDILTHRCPGILTVSSTSYNRRRAVSDAKRTTTFEPCISLLFTHWLDCLIRMPVEMARHMHHAITPASIVVFVDTDKQQLSASISHSHTLTMLPLSFLLFLLFFLPFHLSRRRGTTGVAHSHILHHLLEYIVAHTATTQRR